MHQPYRVIFVSMQSVLQMLPRPNATLGENTVAWAKIVWTGTQVFVNWNGNRSFISIQEWVELASYSCVIPSFFFSAKYVGVVLFLFQNKPIWHFLDCRTLRIFVLLLLNLGLSKFQEHCLASDIYFSQKWLCAFYTFQQNYNYVQ